MEAAGSIQTMRAHSTERSKVFLELTKPRITLMVLVTVAAGFILAPVAPLRLGTLLHTLIGAGMACSGAGALNQYMERSTDERMDRTRFRPLPTRRVSPLTVLGLGSGLTLAGTLYLWSTVGTLPALLNLATAVSYLLIYTPLKRISPLSTLAGAIPGALPPMIGWAGARGELDAGAWVLFTVLFLWQIPHFLAIGRLYRQDYEDGGMPMLVVVDPDGQITGRQMVLYAATLIPVSLCLTVLGTTGAVYFWSALLLGLGYLSAAARAFADTSQACARRLLLTSVIYLPLLFAAIVADRLVS